MKIKGKAIFELTNVETGEKRVVKEENMVTNAYAGLVRGTGLYGGMATYHLRNTDSTGLSGHNRSGDNIRRFSNGLVLFSDKLEEDPNHVFITEDDPDVVGVGADLAYAGTQLCAGSYNSVESGAIENGYKHVWDFTTHQANGDIGCACLTSIEGASLGLGLPYVKSDWKGQLNTFSSEYMAYLPQFEDYIPGCSNYGRGYYNEANNTFIRIKNYFNVPVPSSTDTYTVSNEFDINGNLFTQKVFDRSFIYTKEIELSVFRFPFNNFSIFDEFNQKSMSFTGSTYYYGKLRTLKTVKVKMPTELAAVIPDDMVQASLNTYHYWPTAINFDEGFMYISFVIPKEAKKVPKLESGDKIYTWKINMETFESSWFSITNTTGKTLTWASKSLWDHRPCIIVTNDYTLISSRNTDEYFGGELYIIDNATSSTIKQVVDSDDVPYTSASWRCHFTYKNIVYAFNTSDDPCRMYIINLKTGVVKFVYTRSGYNFNGISTSYTLGRTYGTNFPKIIRGYSSGNNPYARFVMNPMYLLTINNLEDVVTKTSAETMKVTYIITQEEEV